MLLIIELLLKINIHVFVTNNRIMLLNYYEYSYLATLFLVIQHLIFISSRHHKDSEHVHLLETHHVLIHIFILILSLLPFFQQFLLLSHPQEVVQPLLWSLETPPFILVPFPHSLACEFNYYL